MKKDIHPEYREVVFQDVQSDFKFLTRSTMTSDEKIKWEDGKEYPVIKVEVSSASHPFYTCLLYTSPSPRDRTRSRMPSSA